MKFIMNFLRSPFQCRSSDQPSRKVESGSPTVENMFIDPTTGLTTDPKWRASPRVGASSSVAGSPRLQHRVPGFENNGNHPAEVIYEPSVSQSASNDDSEKSHRVRVIPIKVEGVDDSGSPRKRSSAFHSSSGSIPRSAQFGPSHPNFEDTNNRKRHSSGPALHKKSDASESKPKVCNIPIFVEGRDTPVAPKTSQSSQNVPEHTIPSPNTQAESAKHNGGNSAKCSTKRDAKPNVCDISLKQISDILSDFQVFKTAVDEFGGVPQDKQYRYLDEMLTRCMLKLDDVETHCDDAVRASRKAAIKAVQDCINDLESRAQTNSKRQQPSEMSDGTKEKNGSSDSTNTKKEELEVPKGEAGPSTHENIQETTETINKTDDSGNSSSVVHEQSATEEIKDTQQKRLCLEGADSITSNVACAEMTVTKDENKNSREAQDIVNNPVEMEETEAAADEFEKVEEKEQVLDQPVDMVEEIKTSEESVGTGDGPLDSSEVTDIPTHSVVPGDLPKLTEPMDSDEVPDESKVDSDMVEVKDELMDSEMVELAKEPLSAESNKDSSVSHGIND